MSKYHADLRLPPKEVTKEERKEKKKGKRERGKERRGGKEGKTRRPWGCLEGFKKRGNCSSIDNAADGNVR